MARLLVADGDEAVARFVARTLRGEGFDVAVAHDAATALAMVRDQPADLVLADVELPGGGVDLCRRLRHGAATGTVPVVLLASGAAAGQRVLGLAAGADDWVDKPFDTLELVGRVWSLLRRSADRRAASPLTGLPGNVRIEEETAARLATGAPVTAWHVDIDHFKAFNDRYGWSRGDLVIRDVARLLVDAAAGAVPPAFVGHVGGDDFVVLCTPEQSVALATAVVAGFDETCRGFHDPEDARRGYLEVRDRLGAVQRSPLVSLSIGVASATGPATDARRLLVAASGMKTVAKTSPGTSVAVERRRDVP